MSSLELLELVLIISLLALSLGLHEYAHAAVAYARGDDTAKQLGRLTPNPGAHVDPFMTILVPAILYLSPAGFIFGGAKPVPVVPSRLKHPLRDMMWVALAGPATNLVLAFVAMIAFKAAVFWGGYGEADLMYRVLQTTVLFNILLTVFNLLPIPPLDGSRVMAYLLPAGLRETYVGLERFGLILVIAFVFFFPPTQQLLVTSMDWTWERIFDITGGYWI